MAGNNVIFYFSSHHCKCRSSASIRKHSDLRSFTVAVGLQCHLCCKYDDHFFLIAFFSLVFISLQMISGCHSQVNHYARSTICARKGRPTPMIRLQWMSIRTSLKCRWKIKLSRKFYTMAFRFWRAKQLKDRHIGCVIKRKCTVVELG